MRLLSYSEINNISGGLEYTKERDIFNTAAQYSLLSMIFGGTLSGAYAIATNTTVRTVFPGGTTYIQGTFLTTFWSGIGVSCVAGAVLGLGIAYNESSK